MRHHVLAPLTVAILLACSTGAIASTADASLSSFHIQLIDLDAADGIAPSITFQSLQGGTFVAAESGTPAHFVTDAHAAGTAFGDAASTSTQGLASAFASLSGDPFGAGAAASATASSSLSGAYGASTVQLGDGGIYASFTLSPETRLVISGDASASAMSTIDDPFADTWASVFLKLTDFTGQDHTSYGAAVAEQFSTLGAPPVAATDARHIEVSFDNLDAASADGIFFGSIDASASDVRPAAVPEPAGSTLALGGLGVLGLLGWKRKSAR
jgi:hypothetical protein